MIPTSEDETSLTEPLLLSSSISAHYISSVGDIENISECTYENFETDVPTSDYSWKKFASSGNKVTNLSRKNTCIAINYPCQPPTVTFFTKIFRYLFKS
mgnify:CR=1 FL=1